MKSFVAIAVVGLFAVAFAVPLTEEQVKKSQENAAKCAAVHKVDGKVVHQLKKGDFSNNDESTQKFVHCFLQEAGLVDQHGKQQEDVILEKLTKSEKKDKAEIKKVMDECKHVDGTSDYNRSYNAYKCYRTKIADF